MSPLKMPPQIFRLVLLTLGVAGSYATARMLLVPSSFGEYGWFRADALTENAAQKPVYAGMKACDECHSDLLQELAQHDHKTVSCESCHGPSRAHAGDPDITTPKGKFAESDCLRCHLSSPSRPSWFKQVEPNDHYRGAKRCADCHRPHQPKEAP